MATRRGADFVRDQGIAFARCQWETWSPPGWFDEATFEKVAQSFANVDWADVTLHAYRVRWGEADPDPAYAALEARHKAAQTITVPTLMIQGAEDRCVLPSSSEGREQYFCASYTRLVLEGVGHFPTREAAGTVGKLLVELLG